MSSHPTKDDILPPESGLSKKNIAVDPFTYFFAYRVWLRDQLRQGGMSLPEGQIAVEPEPPYNSDGPNGLVPECLVCRKRLEYEWNGNAEYVPNIYEGVVFRSSGQFGSRVLDCGTGIPAGFRDDVQIIVCDSCLLANAHRVNARKDLRPVIRLMGNTRTVVPYSRFVQFSELRRAPEVKKGSE